MRRTFWSSKPHFRDFADLDHDLGCSAHTMARIFYNGSPACLSNVELGDDAVEPRNRWFRTLCESEALGFLRLVQHLVAEGLELVQSVVDGE